MSTLVKRAIEKNIEESLIPGRVLVLYGPRRVGKTTLIDKIRKNLKGTIEYINADVSFEKEKMDSTDFTKLEFLAQGKDYLIIDEAQEIDNIGKKLKILVDHFPQLKILASGSASFDLAQKIGEPLTGRKKTLYLYPFASSEVIPEGGPRFIEKIEEMLIYGLYPKVFELHGRTEKISYLQEIVDNYLYRDILQFEGINNAKKIKDLLTLLAHQVGSEVSLKELGRSLDLHGDTVSKYLDLLEKSFVIYNLRGFSRNLRKEVIRNSKYYFLDTGVRNALISNFNPLRVRDDVGKLWENFCVMERRKYLEYTGTFANLYFWRTYDQKEIDLIEERDGKLMASEFKYVDGKSPIPYEFLETYQNSEFKTYTRDTIAEFIY